MCVPTEPHNNITKWADVVDWLDKEPKFFPSPCIHALHHVSLQFSLMRLSLFPSTLILCNLIYMHLIHMTSLLANTMLADKMYAES